MICLLVASTSVCSRAQSNYYRLGIGAGYGFTHAFTDIAETDFSKAMYGQAEFFITPFISLGGELQSGKIKAGNASVDPQALAFVNSYTAGTVNSRLYLGALVDHNRSRFVNAIKWLYFGAGAGIIRNSISHKNPEANEIYIGKLTSRELVLPANLGLSYYFNNRAGMPRLGINANVQVSFSLGEGMDGYDATQVTFEEGVPDRYHYYSVGIKYQFGFVGLSTRTLY